VGKIGPEKPASLMQSRLEQEAHMQAAATDDETFGLDSFGFATLKSCIDVKTVAEARREILEEYGSSRPLPFRGGGQWFGHLNYVPSPVNPVIQEVVSNRNVRELLNNTLGSEYRFVAVGGNANLPGSRYQPAHIDEWHGSEFLIINIPLDKTTEYNGSTEVWPGTHREHLTLSQLNPAERPSARLNAMPGDLIVRQSKLWHRGTPNKSENVRVMLAILAARSDQILPPFPVSNEEQTRLQTFKVPFNTIIKSDPDRGFRPNYFSTTLKGNALELTWMFAPWIFTEMRRFKKSSI
jgi:hypothetical protein